MLSFSFSIICFLALSASVFGQERKGEGSSTPPSRLRSSSSFRETPSYGNGAYSNQNAPSPSRLTTTPRTKSRLSTNLGNSSPSSSYGFGGMDDVKPKFGYNAASRFGPASPPGSGYGLGSIGGVKDTPLSSGSATPSPFLSRLANRSGAATPTTPDYGSQRSLSSKGTSALSSPSLQGLASPGLSPSKSFNKSSSFSLSMTEADKFISQLETKLKSATLSQSRTLIPVLEDLVSKMTNGDYKAELSLDGTKYNVDFGTSSWQKQSNMIKAKNLLNNQKETLQWISSTVSQVLPQQDARRLSPSSSSLSQGTSNSTPKSSYIYDIRTNKEWEDKILNNPKPVILDIWATTCKPCIRIAPILKKLVDEQGGAVELVKINADESLLPSRLGYTAMPTVEFLYKGSPMRESLVGGHEEIKYRKALSELLEATGN